MDNIKRLLKDLAITPQNDDAIRVSFTLRKDNKLAVQAANRPKLLFTCQAPYPHLKGICLPDILPELLKNDETMALHFDIRRDKSIAEILEGEDMGGHVRYSRQIPVPKAMRGRLHSAIYTISLFNAKGAAITEPFRGCAGDHFSQNKITHGKKPGDGPEVLKSFRLSAVFQNEYSTLPDRIKQLFHHKLEIFEAEYRTKGIVTHPSLRIRKMNRADIFEASINKQYRFFFQYESSRVLLTGCGTHDIMNDRRLNSRV